MALLQASTSSLMIPSLPCSASSVRRPAQIARTSGAAPTALPQPQRTFRAQFGQRRSAVPQAAKTSDASALSLTSHFRFQPCLHHSNCFKRLQHPASRACTFSIQYLGRPVLGHTPSWTTSALCQGCLGSCGCLGLALLHAPVLQIFMHGGCGRQWAALHAFCGACIWLEECSCAPYFLDEIYSCRHAQPR